MLALMIALRRDKKGATAIEYGLIAALVVIGMVVGLTAFANATIGMWNNVSTNIVAAS